MAGQIFGWLDKVYIKVASDTLEKSSMEKSHSNFPVHIVHLGTPA